MSTRDNPTGLYCGSFTRHGQRFLYYVPPGCQLWENQPLPVLRAEPSAGVSWGRRGRTWRAGAATTALSILAHAAPVAVAATCYRDFAVEVIGPLPARGIFQLSGAQITAWLAEHDITLVNQRPQAGMR